MDSLGEIADQRSIPIPDRPLGRMRERRSHEVERRIWLVLSDRWTQGGAIGVGERPEATRVTHAWENVVPIVALVRGYRRQWLRGDLVGGVSACVVMIPSVIAYADLVDLPPASGLYAALAAIVAYAFFASSRQVIAGPDATIALLAASVVGPLARGDPARTAALSGATALLGGALMLIASRLRVG